MYTSILSTYIMLGICYDVYVGVISSTIAMQIRKKVITWQDGVAVDGWYDWTFYGQGFMHGMRWLAFVGIISAAIVAGIIML